MSDQRKPGGSPKETHGPIFKPGDFCKGGRYKIFDLLGAGGMCEVWRAFDEEAPSYEEQWVAVKVLRSKLGFDSDSKKRLEKEARTLLDIQHDNLVRVFHADVDDERNLFFYVMELLQGETLDAKIKRTGGLDLEEALRVVAEIADAAHLLHQLGIIHRDLKPENVYLTEDGRARVLDLGVAKFDPERFPDRATVPTGPNTILGTCPYMSPEQCFGSPLDARSDVYAIGLIAYACIAGFHAAQGSQGGWMPQDYKQWAGWHINNQPKPLPRVMTWLHEKVWKVISKALAKEPADRQRSAAELSAELRGLAAWLMAQDLLKAPAAPVRIRGAAALPLATTERDTTAASSPRASQPSPASPHSTGRGPSSSAEESKAVAPRTLRPAPAAAPSARAPASTQEVLSPRTAGGTEIILIGPASASATPVPRTARGTEIIREAPVSRAALSSARPLLGEGPTPPASSTGKENESAPGALTVAERAQKPTPKNNPRASQSTPTAHSLPVARWRAPRTPKRELAAMGGGGVMLGVCVAALVVVLGGLLRRSSAPSIAGPAVAAAASTSTPAIATQQASSGPPPPQGSATPIASSSASPMSAAGAGQPKASSTAASKAPRKATTATPLPRPISDRIRD